MNHCARVGTTGIRKAKSAIKDAARCLGYTPKEGQELADLIPSICYDDEGEKQTDLSIDESIKAVPKFANAAREHEDLIALAKGLEDLPRSSGLHAAGIIISPDDLTMTMPLVQSGLDNVLATSLSLDDAEKTALKFDFLGLNTLSIIQATEKDAKWHYDYRDDSLLNDKKVWNLIGSANTTGLFQISSRLYKTRMGRLHPKTISELAACLALVRGPCIDSGADEVYMDILNRKRRVELIHPLYDEITSSTNGILIYQEQIMKLCVAFGYSIEDGYATMKLAQKKKMDKLKELRPDFIQHAADKNCNEATANRIFDMIVNAGLYSFNLSHAVCYAYITYVTAYLKVHYPLEFMTNLLTNAYTQGNSNKANIRAVVKDCQRMKLKFLPPDINKSKWEFTEEDGKIRIGLCAIKGFGEKAYLAEKDFEFNSLKDLLENEEVDHRAFNKKVVLVSIFSGMWDSYLKKKEKRYTLYENYWNSSYCSKGTGKNKEVAPPNLIKISASMEFDARKCEGSIATEKLFFDAAYKLPKRAA